MLRLSLKMFNLVENKREVMPYFSIVVPVYNRPQEVKELLESLSMQEDKDFEVILVEDGSQLKSEEVVGEYRDLLNLRYFCKENSGPGLSRNFGAERASGQYILFLDSDCIVPSRYTKEVRAACMQDAPDAFGGPDRAHRSFTPVQKAINYSMTSLLTTGGIRGQKKSMEKFHPRSFNMGFSREVFRSTGGFSGMRFGEDIDMSIRIMEAGFHTVLLPEAYVYHKRRTSFRKFFKQVYNSGGARIHLFLLHPLSLKPVHFLPAVFLLGSIFLVAGAFCFSVWFLLPLGLFMVSAFIDSWVKNKNIAVAGLSVIASFIQLFAYGAGFLHAFFLRRVLKRQNFSVFVKNFYK